MLEKMSAYKRTHLSKLAGWRHTNPCKMSACKATEKRKMATKNGILGMLFARYCTY